jgi:hypothetical protein
VDVCGRRVHSQMAKALPADGRDRSLREDHGHARGLAVRGSIVIVLSLDVVRKLGRNLAEDLVFGLGRGVPSATSLARNFFSWALSRVSTSWLESTKATRTDTVAARGSVGAVGMCH